jgi:7-cyano-7-deazaguanine synthase
MSVILSLSGGLDSTVLLDMALTMFSKEEIHCVYFAHKANNTKYELMASQQILKHYGISPASPNWNIVNLEGIFRYVNSALLRDGDIPLGHHHKSKEMNKNTVPGRNLIFISILAGMAQSLGIQNIYFGVHDEGFDLDTRPEFINGITGPIGVAYGVLLICPLMPANKTEIVKQALRHNVPIHLTRSCYSSDGISCGRCGACQSRLHAFAANGAEDPIPYQTRELIREES